MQFKIICVQQDSNSEPLELDAKTLTNEAIEHSKIVVYNPDIMIVLATTKRSTVVTSTLVAC